MHIGIYNRLIELARARLYTYYSDIALLAGLSMADGAHRGQMTVLLGEILKHEVAEGRPLLTAIVVTKEHNSPGEGFYTTASELGFFNGSIEPTARYEFWIRQFNEVHDYWATY